jgi:predicted metal-dependent HD superfamily phosphohydrolase
MDYNYILEQSEHYARSFFDAHVSEKLIYHNLYHTEEVAAATAVIGRHYTLNEKDFMIVQVAAWFHDIGYLTGEPFGHEERGADMAEAFLKDTSVDKGSIESIRNCILATKIPQRASGLLESIVCDADLFHLGTDEFSERNKLMRKESEAMQHRKISKEEWRKGTIRFLESHHYYTDYCQSLMNEKQHEHLTKLRSKEREDIPPPGGKADGSGLSRITLEAGKEAGFNGGVDRAIKSEGEKTIKGEGENGFKELADKPSKGNKGHAFKKGNPIAALIHEHEETEDTGEERLAAKGGKKTKKEAGKGIDTVFRITSNNNQRLSSMADSKAHILIQVNSIIISVLLSLLLRKIEDHTNLAIPAVILLTVNLITIIFSILATRPHIPPGTFSKADLEEKKVNLLFFGNFYKMNLEEYANGMLQMMDDSDFLYGSLIRDVYFQGIALGKKYRWLRLSYNTFMYGLIASVLAFLIAALAYPAK